MKSHPLLDLCHEMVVVWRLHGPDDWQIEYLNPAWENNLGWPREQLKANGLRAFTLPADNELTRIALVSLLKVGSLTFNNRYQHADGTYRWLLWKCRYSQSQKRIYAVARASADQQYPENNAIIGVTSNGYINGWNRLTENMFNIEMWEALGEKLSLYLDRHQVITDAIKDRHSIEYLISPAYRKGQKVFNLLLSLDIQDDDRLVYGRLTVHDIAASIHTNNYLATLLRRSQSIAKIGGWVSDIGDGLLVWSEELFNILEVNPIDFDHRIETFLKMIHPQDQQVVQEVLRREQKYSLDHRIIIPGGETRWVHAEADSINDAQGKPLQLVGTIQDITTKKLLDIALQDAEAWYRAIVNRISSIIVTIDEQGVLKYGSPSIERILGYNVEKIAGHSIFEALHPDDFTSVTQSLATSVNSPDQAINISVRVRDTKGEWHWFDGSFINLLNQSGVGAIVGSGRETTERVLLEEKLRHKANELTWANAELREFAYVASHDMKEPLRTISVYLDILLKYIENPDPDMMEAIIFIKQAVTRSNGLLEDLLTYSRAGTVPPNNRQVNLNRLVTGVVSNLQGRIEQTKGRVTLHSLPSVFIDPTRIAQVFQNLISNGLKFHKPNVPPVVEVGFDGAKFYVKDNGIGIAKNHHADIFRVFYRLHSFETYSGSGIGLATCKKIVEQHAGCIWVESQPGEGTTVFFTLGASHGENSQIAAGGG